jgi:hypothetical protein
MYKCLYCPRLATFFEEGVRVVSKWFFFKKNVTRMFRACSHPYCQSHAMRDAKNW